MHWLQSLDTALFHFINRSLSNPLFDWLMPVLSGSNGVMRWFVPLVVVLVLAALWCGNVRLRLCVLFMALVVVIGDPLIVNTIKHAIARPRPFVTLPDARQFGVVGKGYVPPEEMSAGTPGLNSMPSSHAANWFAITMVAFLFYRKSWRFMLPLAAAVAFSRVYNGVHYPSDVLAGAILGAGYAAALVIGAQMAWNCAGRKWFPRWHEQLPNLLQPTRTGGTRIQNLELNEKAKAESQDSKPEIEWLRLGCILIVAMLIGRWIYLASGAIELSQDEAYQWVWSKHPALSYYSKPPGIALIQFAGTHIFGDTEFGVRFFSPLFAAILSWMLLRFLTREIGAKISFCVLLIANATPLLGIGTILMTIDPPLVLFWTWAMLAGWRAMQPNGTTRDWLIAGLGVGLAFLCKYSALYEIVCFGIFFALWPPARIHLRKPGPWLALAIFILCTLPVLIWNSQHNWITVTHVESNAGVGAASKIRTLDFLLAEFALLNPIFFIGAIWAMVAVLKFRRERTLWIYFFCMSAPVLLGHLLWSLHSRIQPNWIAPAVIPAFCLMAAYWNEQFQNGRRFVKCFFTVGIALGLLVVAVLYQTNLISKIAGAPLPPEKDPTRRLHAWKQSATLVEAAREKLAADKPAFIICSHYGITGEYSFYIPQAKQGAKDMRPLVYSADSDEPKNQFYFWPEYKYTATRKGQNAIFVSEAPLYKLEDGWFGKWLAHQEIQRTAQPPAELPAQIAGEFESVTDLGEQDVKIGDRVFHRIHLWACHNLK